MKKKLIGVVLSVVLVLTCAFVFCACEHDKVYYTVAEKPAHVKTVAVASNSGTISDNNGTFFNKGTAVNVTVILDSGYGIGNLKVFANGEELEMIPASGEPDNTTYLTKETYEVEEEFQITFSGEPSLQDGSDA